MLRLSAVFGCVLFSTLACGRVTDDTPGNDSRGEGPEATGTGAASPAGGLPSAGGKTAGPPTGGASGVGGSTGSAGAPAGGGASPTGGLSSTGGFATTGGAADVVGGTGGASSIGGLPNTGGAAGSGGVESHGGAPSGGGRPGSGGAQGEGGAETVGGTGGLPRFVGNTTTRYEPTPANLNFADYWDQMTVENAGRWGSVQSSMSAPFNWQTLDAIYDYVETHDVIFKEQALIWGSSQPSGIDSQEHIINWIRSFCERYPHTALIDVVTEPPPHTMPSYENVMGGGTNGDWQWITNAFLWAREYCPGAVLILNDYNNIEWPTENERFIDMVNIVLANGGPIDAIGAQAHDLDHESVTPEIVTELLQKLHDATGLPVYITEMDIDLLDDQEQLEAYQQYFPLFRNTEYVPGITIWGWIFGATWMQAAGLVREGEPRPAMTWLMNELGRPVP